MDRRYLWLYEITLACELTASWIIYCEERGWRDHMAPEQTKQRRKFAGNYQNRQMKLRRWNKAVTG
jgi:hypothetical protein